MKVTELRIGNWVDEHGEYKQVSLNDNDLWHTDNFKGIPITFEILGKAGFEVEGDAGNWANPDYTIYKLKDKYFMVGLKDAEFFYYRQCDDDYYSSYWPELKSLHQLQNLYFALTGTELEINLNP